jgi:hypothetical protein
MSKIHKKKPKLESKAKIRRRLFKLWSKKVMLIHNNVCAVTGAKRGELVGGKPVILDAHHLENRSSIPALRFEILNGIALTKSSHKFGKNSAHKGSIWFAEWLRQHRPKQYAYVLAHRDDPIDLDDRDTLAKLEIKLSAPPTTEELEIIGMTKVCQQDQSIPSTPARLPNDIEPSTPLKT